MHALFTGGKCHNSLGSRELTCPCPGTNTCPTDCSNFQDPFFKIRTKPCHVVYSRVLNALLHLRFSVNELYWMFKKTKDFTPGLLRLWWVTIKLLLSKRWGTWNKMLQLFISERV